MRELIAMDTVFVPDDDADVFEDDAADAGGDVVIGDARVIQLQTLLCTVLVGVFSVLLLLVCISWRVHGARIMAAKGRSVTPPMGHISPPLSEDMPVREELSPKDTLHRRKPRKES